MRRVAPVVLITLLFIPGCGNGDGLAVRPGAAVDLDPDDPSILMRPFTAEEIRDEWVPGFRLLMRRTFPEETRIERWTVVSADDDGVEIEYATIADDGSVEGEPSVSRSGWTELRDHAAFPAAHSTREWISRDTALGQFEGWLYTVAEPGAAVVKEFFFVPELPGAPVQMRILEGDETVFALEQTARLRPDVD
jgi:hypothetical protein